MKINYMQLRILIKEYAYYNGRFPLLSDIYKKYKEKFDYNDTIQGFGRDLYLLQKEGHRIGFIEEEKKHTYKYAGKTKIVKRKVKRIIVR